MDDTNVTDRHGVTHTAKATCSSEPSLVSNLVQEWCAGTRKVKHFEHSRLCCTRVGRSFCFAFPASAQQPTTSHRSPKPQLAKQYSTFSGQVLRRSRRVGRTVCDKAAAAIGSRRALKRSRFRFLSVERALNSLGLAESHWPS